MEANFSTLRVDLGKLKDGVGVLDAKLIAFLASAGGTLSTADAAALQGLVDDSAAIVKQA